MRANICLILAALHNFENIIYYSTLPKGTTYNYDVSYLFTLFLSKEKNTNAHFIFRENINIGMIIIIRPTF